MLKTYLFLLSTLLILTNTSYCQTGPGGVGTNNGTSELVLWLDASKQINPNQTKTTKSDTTKIYEWKDLSGYNNDAKQINQTNRPFYKPKSKNNLPSVAFNLTTVKNNFLTLELTHDPTINFCTYLVTYATNINQNQTILQQTNSGSINGRRHLFLNTNKNWSSHIDNAYHNSLNTYNPNQWCIPYLEFKNKTLSICQDGKNEGIFLNINPVSNNGKWLLGIYKHFNTEWYNGEISEVIFFKTAINQTQRIIIENYLSGKYDIPLQIHDIYTNDNIDKGNFDFDIAGIGKINDNDYHNTSRGTGIVLISNPSNLNNNEFLFWGHNNLSITTSTSDNLANNISSESRLNRIWRVNETDTNGNAIDIGTIDITFDLSGIIGLNKDEIRLLIDFNNDGIFEESNVKAIQNSQNTNLYSFIGVSEITNNSRFTLGTISQTPLPITLTNFSLTKTKNNFVKIIWQTATEINNKEFIIERSKDAINWEEVSIIEGKGNSYYPSNYEIHDFSPLVGTSYYRLKQIDYNDKYSYSSILSISIYTDQINVYPNPTKNYLTINCEHIQSEAILIYNIHGQNITNQIQIENISENLTLLNLGNIAPGIYYLNIKNKSHVIQKH